MKFTRAAGLWSFLAVGFVILTVLLIFITQNLLTITLVTVVMVAINPVLALIALIPAPLIVFTASRYNRVSRPAQQEVQQRIACRSTVARDISCPVCWPSKKLSSSRCRWA